MIRRIVGMSSTASSIEAGANSVMPAPASG
jgi:hypothetical protein